MEGRYYSKLIDDGYAGDVIDDVVCDMKYISDGIIKALGESI